MGKSLIIRMFELCKGLYNFSREVVRFLILFLSHYCISINNNNIFIKVLIVTLLFFTFLFPAKAESNSQEKMITVVFRFDDYSSRSSTDIEIKLIDAFQKYNACCTFGVIPFVCTGDVHDAHPQDVVPLTSMKADILKNAIKAGVLEVALHGYSHQTNRERRFAEFSGLDYNDQVEKIAMGKNYLEEILGTQVTTFIPPWNAYDLNTIHALEKLGFKSISASECGDTKGSSPLKFLPATFNLLRLRDAVKLAKHIPDVQPVIVVLFHQYDFLEIDRERGKLTYQDFLELLAWITSQKDIQVRSIEQATKVIEDLSASRYINYNSYRKLSYLIPPISKLLSKSYHSGVYLESNNSQNMRIKCWSFIFIFYLTILVTSIIIAFLAGSVVFPRSWLIALISRFGSLLLLVFLSIYAFRNLDLYYKGAIVISTLLGVCIGVWASFIKLKVNTGFHNSLRQKR